jgi:hypothetical protein
MFEIRVLRRIFEPKRDEVQCGILDISHPYRPRPATGIALFFNFYCISVVSKTE